MSDTDSDEKIDPESLERATFTGVFAAPQTEDDPTLVFKATDGPLAVRLAPEKFEALLSKRTAFDQL